MNEQKNSEKSPQDENLADVFEARYIAARRGLARDVRALNDPKTPLWLPGPESVNCDAPTMPRTIYDTTKMEEAR